MRIKSIKSIHNVSAYQLLIINYKKLTSNLTLTETLSQPNIMANKDKVSTFLSIYQLEGTSLMQFNLQKRRAEKDLKELWQYIDAKYFLKFSKQELFSKIESILREIAVNQSSNLGTNKLDLQGRGLGMVSQITQGKYPEGALPISIFEASIRAK